MKIQTLRRWDVWVGRPACLLLTALYKLKSIVVKKQRVKSPKKMLFIKLFGMGSIILAVPAIEAVKKKYPMCSFFFLTFKENHAILSLLNIVPEGNIYTVRKDSLVHFLEDVVICLVRMIKERIDIVIDLEFFSRFTAILSFFIRSKWRIGFYGFHTEGLKRGVFIDSLINYNHTLHTSRAFFTLLTPLGISQKEYSSFLPYIPPSEGFREKVVTKIREANESFKPGRISEWIVMNPNSSGLTELRRWPAGHFAKLADLLLAKRESVGVVFIGSTDEKCYTESICNAVKSCENASRIVNLSGLTDLRDLVDLFHFSDLLITNDSGPAHLSSLTRTPGLVLFGPETPDLYSPIGEWSRCLYLGLDCQPCITVYNGKRSFCKDNICLQLITPESVLDLAVETLERNRLGRSNIKTCAS